MKLLRMKIGDKVRVKAQYDENCDDDSYPFCFTEHMLKHYGGTVVTIDSMFDCPSDMCRRETHKVDNTPDNYVSYKIKEDKRDYNWSLSMFQEESVKECCNRNLTKRQLVNMLQSYPDDAEVQVLHHNGSQYEGRTPKIVVVNNVIQIL